MNRFLKIFLVVTILVWPFTGLYFYAEWGIIQASTLGLICALIAGLTMAHVIDDFLFLSRKKEGIRNRISPFQTKSTTLNLPDQDVFDQCITALKSYGAKIKYYDQNKKKIRALTGFSWESFGEIITVNIIHQDNYQSLVKIESRPVVPFTMTDHGKGRKNVEGIVSLIEKIN